MSSRIDDLEKSIQDLMVQVSVVSHVDGHFIFQDLIGLYTCMYAYVREVLETAFLPSCSFGERGSERTAIFVGCLGLLLLVSSLVIPEIYLQNLAVFSAL